MRNILKIRRLFLFILSLVILFGASTVIAQEDILEGKVFVGQSRVKHTRTTKKDELRFMNGKFNSVNYSQKGFGDGVYKAEVKGDKIYFEAETLSPEEGKIRWSGIVDGDSIEVNFHWSKKGWFSDTEKDYVFKGTLKR